MPRGKRTKLHVGVYRDNHGHAIIVKRHGRYLEKRYPPDKTVGWLRNERERLIETLNKKGPRGTAGTLAGDISAYLKTLPEAKQQERGHWCEPWIKALGTTPRADITAQMVRQTMAGWDCGPSTLNHRRQALRAVYKAMDGPDASTPCDDVKRAKERREMRVVPRAVVLAILRRLPPCATTARLKVLARTGWPHAQIAQLKPHDIDYAGRVVRVTGRKKGGGTRDLLIPISYTAARALRLMERYGAWGEFSRHSMRKLFLRAVVKAQAKWKGIWPAPANLHPYDLRHAFITLALHRSGGNLLGVSKIALHSDISMTAFYAGSAANPMALDVRDALDRKVPPKSANFRPKTTKKPKQNTKGLGRSKGGTSPVNKAKTRRK